MSTESMIAFVHLGVDKSLKRNSIISMDIVLSFFGMLCGIFGFFCTPLTLLYAIVIYILCIINGICSIVITSKLNLKRIIIHSSLRSILCMFIFIFNSAIFFEKAQMSSFFILPIPLFFTVLYMIFIHSSVKSEAYVQNNNKINISIVSTLAITGAIAGRILINLIPENVEGGESLILTSIVLCFISVAFALGMTNFLKLYYIKFLKKKGINIDE